MNRKISVGLALTFVIASITATFAITMSVSQKIYNGLISDLASRVEMYSAIEDINALVRTNYFYYASINSENINLSITEGYINGLGDDHNRFLNASEYIDYQKKLAGNASGVGITTAWDSENGYLKVTSVANGSSAYAKGMEEGDIISKIDNEKVKYSNYKELVEKLNGDNLTTIDITCNRGGEIKEFKVTIGYSYISVSHKNLSGIGYIKINAFYSNTRDQLLNAIDELQGENVTGIIFDLRATSQGSVEYAAKAVDSITPLCDNEDEVIVSLVGRSGETTFTYPSTSSDLNMPMTVLVNADTAGPAELFACVLRDFEKAKLVGDTTSGTGTAQKALNLEDGSAVILTVAKIKPYKSESFEKNGLVPDFEVSLDEADVSRLELLSITEDAQLQKAIELLVAN